MHKERSKYLLSTSVRSGPHKTPVRSTIWSLFINEEMEWQEYEVMAHKY